MRSARDVIAPTGTPLSTRTEFLSALLPEWLLSSSRLGARTNPKASILTATLGIVGALVATYLGQAIGWYQAGQGAGFIASIVGAVLILLVWGFIASRRA